MKLFLYIVNLAEEPQCESPEFNGRWAVSVVRHPICAAQVVTFPTRAEAVSARREVMRDLTV